MRNSGGSGRGSCGSNRGSGCFSSISLGGSSISSGGSNSSRVTTQRGRERNNRHHILLLRNKERSPRGPSGGLPEYQWRTRPLCPRSGYTQVGRVTGNSVVAPPATKAQCEQTAARRPVRGRRHGVLFVASLTRASSGRARRKLWRQESGTWRGRRGAGNTCTPRCCSGSSRGKWWRRGQLRYSDTRDSACVKVGRIEDSCHREGPVALYSRTLERQLG